MLRAILLSVAGAASVISLSASSTNAQIVVAGPSQALSSSSGDWNWENGTQLSPFKTALADQDNFGPGGTVDTALTLTTLNTIDATSLAGVDILVLPWWHDADSTPEQVSAIQNFFFSGGRLFLLDDSSGQDEVAESLGVPSSGSDGSASNDGAPLFDGPFGTASDITQNGSTGQLLQSDIDAANGHAGAINGAGQVTAAFWDTDEFQAGAGRMIILGDVDMITPFGSGEYDPLNDKGKFALNAVAFLIEGSRTVPPPVIPLPPAALSGLAGLAMIGAGQIASRLRRR
jgi:hypothetical protein